MLLGASLCNLDPADCCCVYAKLLYELLVRAYAFMTKEECGENTYIKDI